MEESRRWTLDRRKFVTAAGVVGGAALVTSCTGGSDSASASLDDMPQDALGVAKARGLSSDDVLAAVKTYVPSGKHDTHYVFASGGHSGQIWVIGVPSMRIIKVIPVFANSSFQGWGYSDGSKEVLKGGEVDGKKITMADTHHPGLSETKGEYDGQWLFINDKINSRIAVIDLRDFHTKQIVKNPFTLSDHGMAVTPDTEYVIESSHYGMPPEWESVPLTKNNYRDKYRGIITYWKFDRQKGRIDPSKSFAIELPPYMQDLTDAGKGPSAGWSFTNSFNTELAVGGKTPMEVGASQRDTDYLHMVNWRAAEKLVQARKGFGKKVAGIAHFSIDEAVRNNLLYLLPEPKSPHGVDVTPTGEYIVVNGKLDPHVTIYSWKKIQAQIKAGKFEKDQYGIPILDFKSTVAGQVEVGLGPLHTQFDDKGFAYTSLFLESKVARWTVGGEDAKSWKLKDKIAINYNVGHLCALGGDTVKPGGGYLISLNKWSLDRFLLTGPHHPVNLQLIDISQPDKMQLLRDLPIPDGEPHYAQMIPAEKIKAEKVYPMGWDPVRWEKDPQATAPGKHRIVRNGKTVDVYQTLMRSNMKPDLIEVNEGDTVRMHISNIETAENASHGWTLSAWDISVDLSPGQVEHVTFTADKAGTYTYYCTEFCSALHLEMFGYLIVNPA